MGEIVLQGIVGSQAYGLAGPDSDTDRLGLYIADTNDFLGLSPPVDQSHVTKDPDLTQHEALKFCRLALKCNPTVMELLWLTEYEVNTPSGRDLIFIRKAFLSRHFVRNAYLGYATSQFKEFQKRGGDFGSDLKKRTTKHARHLLRLLNQGLELYVTGELTIKLGDPEMYHRFGDAVANDPDGLAKAKEEVARVEARFDEATSPLPEQSDRDLVERWLLRVRLNSLPQLQAQRGITQGLLNDIARLKEERDGHR